MNNSTEYHDPGPLIFSDNFAVVCNLLYLLASFILVNVTKSFIRSIPPGRKLVKYFSSKDQRRNISRLPQATSDVQLISLNVLLLLVSILPIAIIIRITISGYFVFWPTFLVIELFKIVFVYGK